MYAYNENALHTVDCSNGSGKADSAVLYLDQDVYNTFKGINGGSWLMTMQELELDILNDLKELGDAISQYTFLIACAGECPPFPEEAKDETHLVRECQVNTWIIINVENGIVSLQIESESLIVKGALSLLAELYNGRSLDEVRAFHCTLPDNEDFSRHFNHEQLEGVRAIIRKLGCQS